MLTNSNFYKIDSEGNIVRVSTDDIPEGSFNKYCLNYVDGKSIGDIVLRNDPTEKLAHSLLDGRRIHAYESKLFVEWAEKCKDLSEDDVRYDFFDKTEEDYEEFLSKNVFEDTQEHYCPYYVVKTEEITVYQVSNDVGTIGYTYIEGEADTEFTQGYIFTDNKLTAVLTNIVLDDALTNESEWYYNGISEIGEDRYVRIPTYPTYNNGNMKSYYFIITDSRSDNDMTSIRSVKIGEVKALDSSDAPYVDNVGTAQQMILDFGIPKGNSATIQIGNITSGNYADVVNVGTSDEAVFDFVLPRGEQGPAGGVVSLAYIGTSVPNTAKSNDKYYNTDENVIYIYNNGSWDIYDDADEGVIYIKDSIVYHFNGTNIVEFSNIIYSDDDTIERSANGELTTVGVKSKSGVVLYDWIGTLEEWNIGRDNDTIKDNWICFITDDEII